jgi:hypothetical protein
MINGNLPPAPERLTLSSANFGLLLNFLDYVDLQRNTTVDQQIISQQTLDFYHMLDRFFYDRPAVRLSVAGISLGALMYRDSQAEVLSNLERENLLDDQSLNDAKQLSEQVQFMKNHFNEYHPEFVRHLKISLSRLVVETDFHPELALVGLSTLWSASRSDSFRHEVESIIGERFRD